VRSGAAIHWFRGPDHELPDRSLRLPTFRATVMRSSIVRCIFRRNGPTIQIAWKPHTCPPSRLCDQTKACDENDRTRHSRRLYHSSGLLVTPSTVLAISNSNYARQAKAMYSGSAALSVFRSWGKQRQSPGKDRRHRPDAALVRLETPFGRGRKPKDRGCMIGVISNWPISISTAQIKVCGRAVC